MSFLYVLKLIRIGRENYKFLYYRRKKNDDGKGPKRYAEYILHQIDMIFFQYSPNNEIILDCKCDHSI